MMTYFGTRGRQGFRLDVDPLWDDSLTRSTLTTASRKTS